MRLTRANVTVASRIMLPTYVGFFGVLGLNFLLFSPNRLTQTPALQYANSVMDLRAWGMAFLMVAALMAEALWLERRRFYQGALLVCAGSMGLWAGVIAFAAFKGHGSPFGAVWPAFVMCACLASYRSLGAMEA